MQLLAEEAEQIVAEVHLVDQKLSSVNNAEPLCRVKCHHAPRKGSVSFNMCYFSTQQLSERKKASFSFHIEQLI